MILATSSKSSSLNPLVVIAGVPIRIPEALNGFSVSKGIAFLLAVILISSSKRCAFLPEIPQLALTSTSNKWLSVPPATNRLVAGGTDNHLLLVDVKASCGISGKKAQRLLDEINITANKNAIPFDTEKPFKASGIRIGTPAMTTKGFKEEDFEEVARIIAYRLKNEETDEIKEECLKRVAKLTEKVTMYSNIKYI